MTTDALLDLVQRLLAAAQHPDVTGVARYEGALKGVVITYQSGAKAFFALPASKVSVEPAEFPEVMPEWKFRRLHALRMLLDVLDVAKPAGVSAWRTVAIAGIEARPAGVELRTDSGTVVLHVTSGGPMILDSDPADFADWKVPDTIVVD